MQHYLHQPNISPVLLHLWGPLQIRWYSLLYVGGFMIGWMVLRYLSTDPQFKFSKSDAEEIIIWMLVGTVLGARIAYCFIYDPVHFLSDPFYFFKVYQGGLSFHGGLVGGSIGIFLYSRHKKLSFWMITDACVLAVPIGLGLGRIGNFINGELYGRVSYVPWGIIYQAGGPLPRHPSQIYEFLLEGLLLCVVLWVSKKHLKRHGQLSVLFLLGYSICRFVAEFFREPDPQVGYLIAGLTMGQLLSIIMFVSSALLGYVLFEMVKTESPIKKQKSIRSKKQSRKK